MRRRTKTRLRLLLRRLTLYLLLPAALLLTARLLWGLEAAHRLNQLHADLRAAHIPYTPDAYLDPPIPDNQNAIIPLLHALAAYNLTESESDLLLEGFPTVDFLSPNHFTPSQLPEVDRILQKFAPVFHDLDDAARRPATAWPPADFLDRPEILNDIRLFNATRIAVALSLSAQRAHEHQDSSGTLRPILQMLSLSRLTDSRPATASHLTATSLRARAADTAHRLALGLRFTPDSRPLLQSLVASLTDPAFEKSSLPALTTKTVVLPDEIKNFSDLSQWPLQPLATDELVRAIRLQLVTIHAATHPDFPAIRSALPDPPGENVPLDLVTLSASSSAFINIRYFQLHFRALADSRATALLLAAELFHQDHNRYPTPAEAATLLTGDAAIDPFSPDHHPFRYRLDPAGPTVWSVSENATDEGGVPPVSRYPGGRLFRWEQPDAVYGAAWRTTPPPTPPSTPPSPPPIPPATLPAPSIPPPPPTP